MFDQLIRETDERFGLGEKAGLLVRSVLGMIANEDYGAMEGFLEAFDEEGMGPAVRSWVGTATGEPLSAAQVETGLGPGVVSDLAAELGLDVGTAGSALGFVIPRVVDLLTPDGTVPPHSWLLSRIDDFPGGAEAADDRSPGQAVEGARATAGGTMDEAVGTARRGGGPLRWLLPLLVLALLVWWLAGRSRPQRADLAPGEGTESTRETMGVDLPRRSPGPGATDAGTIPAGPPGAGPETPRSTAETAPGAGDSAGKAAAPPSGPFDAKAAVERAHRAAGDALGALGDAAGAQELVNALNLSIIDFAPGSAAIPAASETLLAAAARVMQRLPAATRIEIGGHTDSTGAAAANRALSTARARAVRNTLVAHGAPAEMLSVRGFGSSQPVAGNETAEGRFRNRRISYRLDG